MARYLKHFLLLVVFLSSHCVSKEITQNSSHDLIHSSLQGPLPRDFPCPDKNEIKPCVCIPGGVMVVDMHCHDVTDEVQLAQVFTAKFWYRHYRSLVMIGNTGVKELRAGVFGDITFQELRLVSGALEKVEIEALAGSRDTLNLMHFYYNNIHDFPIAEFASFSRLREVRLYGNQFTFLPPLVSSTLEIFSIGYNPLQFIFESTFSATPALREVHLYGTNLTELQPGVFGGLTNLSFVSLRDNRLSTLPGAAVTLGGRTQGLVCLENNAITTVNPNAITGLGGGTVSLQDNSLVEISELVWRPLIDANITLDLRNNPLKCECDLAWLVLNPGRLARLEPDTTCQDGQRLVDLDPILFQDC